MIASYVIVCIKDEDVHVLLLQDKLDNKMSAIFKTFLSKSKITTVNIVNMHYHEILQKQ